MAYVVLPYTLAAKSRAEKPSLLSPAQRNKSPWAPKAKIILLAGVEEWSFTMVVRPLATEAEIREARAFFFALEGIANTFELPFLPTPQGGAVITAAAAAGAGAKQITVSSAAGIVPGMPLSITLPTKHKRLVIVTKVNGAVLTIQPGLTEAIAIGAEIEVSNPVCHVRLEDPQFVYDDSKGVAGFAVRVVEAVHEPGSDPLPLNTAAPAITGTLRELEELTVSNGTWSNAPTSFAYQWYRNGVAVVGATANTFDLSVNDEGNVIKARVTAINAAGARHAFSNEVTIMPGIAPTNTVLPSIDGAPFEDETLTANDGTWTGAPTSFTYQWKRDGVAISGATADTYVATALDVDTDITVTVTAHNSFANTPATSAPLTILDFTPADLFVGGKLGVWWDPADPSSMWKDAAGTVAAVVDQPVYRVDDKSGNGHHYLQPTSAAQMMLRSDGTHYWLEADGVDDIYNVAIDFSTFTTMGFCHSFRPLNISDWTLTTGNPTLNTTWGMMQGAGAGNDQTALVFWQSGTDIRNSPVGFGVGVDQVISMQAFDPSQAAAASKLPMRVNGSSAGVTTSDDSAGASAFTNTTFAMGGDAVGGLGSPHASFRWYGTVMLKNGFTNDELTAMEAWHQARHP